jgi:acyl dehydratase
MEEGQSYTTRSRTVTEADIVNFAGVSGDFNPMHISEEYAAQTQFGQRVAHGMLGLSMATGQSYATGMLDGTVLAFTGLEWKFRAPIYIGDSIKTIITISKKREMKKAGGGFVTFDVKVTNQNDEVTQKGAWTILVASRPDHAGDEND